MPERVDLAEQTRLADTGVSDERDDPASAGAQIADRTAESRDLVIAPEQRTGPGAQRLGGTTGDHEGLDRRCSALQLECAEPPKLERLRDLPTRVVRHDDGPRLGDRLEPRRD